MRAARSALGGEALRSRRRPISRRTIAAVAEVRRHLPGNGKRSRARSRFSGFARTIERAAGHPSAFLGAVLVVAIWAATGPVFHFSDTWQLVINTGTTILTFLMVFLIQNAQNRGTEAIQAKLDELIRAVGGAENAMIDLEDLEEQELHAIHERFVQLAKDARARAGKRGVMVSPVD